LSEMRARFVPRGLRHVFRCGSIIFPEPAAISRTPSIATNQVAAELYNSDTDMNDLTIAWPLCKVRSKSIVCSQ
jgi:hypothetical protein